MSEGELQTARYESEAELTRERIASTVDDLHERLNPKALVADVADAFQDSTEAFIDSGSQFVREHPAVLAGVGVAAGVLLIVRNRLASRVSYDPYEGYGYADSGAGGDTSGSAVRRGWSKFRGGASSARAHLTDTAHAAGDYASDNWNSARSRAEDYADRARARSWENGTTVENNPLAILLIGIATGAFLGSILPRTRVENDYLGDTSDRLTEAARHAARTAVEVGRRDMEERGVSKSGAKSLLHDIGDRAKDGLGGITDVAKERLRQAAADAQAIARNAGAAASDDFKSQAKGTAPILGDSSGPATY